MTRIFFLILTLLICLSCQKEVEKNLNDKNPLAPYFLGWITNLSGTQEIQILKTNNFSSNPTPNYITNGIITVTNNSYIENFVNSGLSYFSSPNYSLNSGSCIVKINVDGKTYTESVELFDPIELNEISFSEDVYEEGIGTETGIFVDFNLPSEDNYSILFELFADSTGNGDQFESLTPDIHSMELFENYVDEYNEYGDILLFQNQLVRDDGSILYKLIAHRISNVQYNYLLRIQEEPSESVYATQPVNLPTMFSNGGLGIVIVSSDSVIEFNF